MAISTTTTLTNLLPQIVVEALYVANEQSLMTGLVRNYDMANGVGTSIDVPIYPVVTASVVAETADATPQTITPTKVNLALQTIVAMAEVTDFAVKTSPQNVISDIGRVLGNAIATKRDQDLTALFAGFSQVIGGTNTAITPAFIFQAIAELKNAGKVTGGLVGVFNPLVAHDLKSALTSAFTDPNAGDIQNEAMRSGYLGMLAGVAIYESANVSETTGDSIGGIFHREALGLVTLNDMEIELERNASLQSTEIVASAVYGVGELQDSLGRAMSFDSSLAINAA